MMKAANQFSFDVSRLNLNFQITNRIPLRVSSHFYPKKNFAPAIRSDLDFKETHFRRVETKDFLITEV